MKTKTVLAGAVVLACAAAFALPVAAADNSSTHAMPGADNSNFKTMDTNGDGKVSREEYMRYYQSDWDRMDSSKSGSLTSDQYQKAKEQQQQKSSDGNPSPKK